MHGGSPYISSEILKFSNSVNHWTGTWCSSLPLYDFRWAGNNTCEGDDDNDSTECRHRAVAMNCSWPAAKCNCCTQFSHVRRKITDWLIENIACYQDWILALWHKRAMTGTITARMVGTK